MKIACLVRARPHHAFFVNRVHSRHTVALAVIESPPATARLMRVLNRDGSPGVARVLIDRYYHRKARARRLSARFGDDWRGIDPGIEQLRVASINDGTARARLEALQPDLILDHGTSIVGNEVIATGGLALNVHWGLSPYYRGVRCTEWALINWDPYNIGVTVHKLDQRIDGGDVAGQKRVVVEAGDDVEAINHRLTRAGTEIVLDLIARLEAGAGLAFSPTAASDGHLFLKKHFSRHLARQVAEIERKGLIEEMLRTPSRRTLLPIHESIQLRTTSKRAV